MTITSAELAEALRGCKVEVEWDEPIGRTSYIRNSGAFTIIEVTPPPKKPEVKEEFAAWWMELGLIGAWTPCMVLPRNTCNTPPAPDYWLRRETIDGIPQVPTVVRADESNLEPGDRRAHNHASNQTCGPDCLRYRP